jgi:hypothetical protein
VLHPGEAEAIIFLDNSAGYVFEQDASGLWRQTGQLRDFAYCATVRESLEKGELTLDPHPWPDLMIGDQRLDVSPLPHGCPTAPAAHPPSTTPARP